jgi:hypothetical protein
MFFIFNYIKRAPPVNLAKTALLAEKGRARILPRKKFFAHPRARAKDADKQKCCWHTRLAIV